MSQKQSNVDTKREEHKTYQVVEILKNNIMDEVVSSDGSNSNVIEPVSGTNKAKTRKSLFTTLIKKEHLKQPKMKITKKIHTCSTINFGSSTSDQELTHCQISSEVIQTPIPRPKNAKHCNIFKKIIRRSGNNLLKKPALILRSKSCTDPSSCNRKRLKFIPTTYIPKSNIKLINGINELQSILHNLHHSEQHMIFLLKKYVEDKTIQDQIFETSCEYFALQYDSKCQTNILANKMWIQQVEVSKIQNHNLQKRLNFVIETNRVLESQIEDMRRQCEKLTSKTKLYPKRFLHMRSFGKLYAKQLIDNNRRLQQKVQTLTEVITDFEEEMQKLQHHKDVLEEEKRSLRSQIHHLEGVVEKQGSDRELEKSALKLQINHDGNVLKDAVAAAQFIFQDLHEFEQQLGDFSVRVTWPNFQHEDACLPEIIYHLRACIKELFLTMIAVYRNLALVTKDITKLRNTNARLQENLQKSTNELNNLSKKLEKKSEIDVNALEAHCRKFEQDNISLKVKLENTIEENALLREEVEVKKRTLSKTKTNANDLLTQNQTVCLQIDDLVVAISQLGQDELSREFSSNQEKFDYLKLRFSQMMADQKHLAERCKSLEDENQHALQTQQEFEQDFHTFQDGITLLSAENESIKKQLLTSNQTITSLQNERVKYLEEKNILKTIFQHLKGEVSRIQQLEGAVADMNKETSRLSLIAEFNKQLGEQLKTEVEVKEHTILELRQSLEKLSHIQIDNDKEKMSLCAQLSEVATVKDKLSSCLEMELQKNVRLDESKKKMESNTKSQIKLYEEMQRNERAALKQLLKDFKSLIKQRDCLVLLDEGHKKKYKELEKHYVDLKKQFDGVTLQDSKKDEEIRAMDETIQNVEEEHRMREENYSITIAKSERNVKKLEKHLVQMSNEKSELETSNTLLSKDLQQLQRELNETRERALVADNKMSMKAAECSTLESELNSYKNQLQLLSQEHGKVLMEIDYVKKIHEQQTLELKDTISNCCNKDGKYLETHAAIIEKEHKINELTKILLEREGETKRLEQECNFLKKQTEDQNKIMIGYENQIVALQDNETSNLRVKDELRKVLSEHQTNLNALESIKKENEALRNELKNLITKNENEKSLYQRKTSEIIGDYSQQKATIEEEIESISSQLRAVTDNLHSEKLRFDELAKAHDELKTKYNKIRGSFNSEMTAHKDAHRKIKSLESLTKTITTERDNLQSQVHMLLLDIGEEKDINYHLLSENKRIQAILEQGRDKYTYLKSKNLALEEEVKDLKYKVQSATTRSEATQNEIGRTLTQLEEKTEELKSAKETIDSLRKELTESQKTLFDLKEELFKTQQQVTGIEFKNCELTLQLHEIQGKLETERNLYNELKVSNAPARTPPPAPSEYGELFYIGSGI